jgi:AcrR family transcriptional regulator
MVDAAGPCYEVKRNGHPLYAEWHSVCQGHVVDGAVRGQSADSGAQNGSDQALRADAQRNYDSLVEAAAAVFATSGVDAPIKEIADRAGVGIGTVYRRFPKRSDLIVAVFRREVDGCAHAAKILAAEYAPFEALSRWIQRYLDLILTKRGLAAALHSGEPAYQSLPGYFEQRLVLSLASLLQAAEGEIHVDVSAAELLRAVPLLCSPATSGDFAQTRRMVALLINGLRVPACSGGEAN